MARMAPASICISRHPWRSDGEVQLSPQRKSCSEAGCQSREHGETNFFAHPKYYACCEEAHLIRTLFY